MALVFSNLAETSLAAPALVDDVALTVSTGTATRFKVLNAGESEMVVLTDGINFEVVEVTAWNGDVATVTRGVGGTAQAWATGTIFSARMTAEVFARMVQRVDLPAAITAELSNNATVVAAVNAAVAASAGGGGSTSPVHTNVVQIPNGATVFDATTYNADLTQLPDYFLVDWARTAAIQFKLPALDSLLVGELAKIELVTTHSTPSGSFHIDISVPAGHYMNNTLDGTDYMSYANYAGFYGYKAADGTMHWIY